MTANHRGMDSLPTDLSWNYDTLFSAFCFLLPVSLPFCVFRVFCGQFRIPLRLPAVSSFSAKNRNSNLTFIRKCGSLTRMRSRETVKLPGWSQAAEESRENRLNNFIVKASLLQTIPIKVDEGQ